MMIPTIVLVMACLLASLLLDVAVLLATARATTYRATRERRRSNVWAALAVAGMCGAGILTFVAGYLHGAF